MILYPPVQFNENEWYLIAVGALLWSIVFRLPKRFSALTIATIWAFVYFVAQTTDFTIGVPPYDLYDTNDWPEFEIVDLIVFIFIYPPVGYLMLYLYDYWKLSKLRMIAYVIVCAYITQLLEWISTRWFHVFTYKGWNIWYSGPVYIAVYFLYIVVFRFVQRYVRRNEAKSN